MRIPKPLEVLGFNGVRERLLLFFFCLLRRARFTFYARSSLERFGVLVRPFVDDGAMWRCRAMPRKEAISVLETGLPVLLRADIRYDDVDIVLHIMYFFLSCLSI